MQLLRTYRSFHMKTEFFTRKTGILFYPYYNLKHTCHCQNVSVCYFLRALQIRQRFSEATDTWGLDEYIYGSVIRLNLRRWMEKTKTGIVVEPKTSVKGIIVLYENVVFPTHAKRQRQETSELKDYWV